MEELVVIVRVGLSAALLSLFLFCQCFATTLPDERWLGAYVGKHKIGYASFRLENSAKDDKPGYRLASTMDTHLKILGAEVSQLVQWVVFADLNYVPVTQDFSMSSGGRTTTVRAVFFPDRVECVLSSAGGSSTKIVPVPVGAKLIGDTLFGLKSADIHIGETGQYQFFNPLTLTIDCVSVKSLGIQKINVVGREVEAVVLQTSTNLGDIKLWQTSSGDVLRIEAVMGISMVAESKEKAMEYSDISGQEDMATLTSVETNRHISSPRTTKSLDITFTGLTDSGLVIRDSRQAANTLDADKGVVSYQITAKRFAPDNSARLPIAGNEFVDSLIATPYLDYDTKIVSERAKEIAGSEANAYMACTKLHQWVNKNMTTRADIGIARTASDVLANRRGVCRDYAVLLAAMARALGIPARVVSGVVFVDKAFFYHSWVECFVGEWTPFDSTLATDFVDATHIKFAEGDATSMFTMSKVIGHLKAEVNEAK